MRALGSEKRQIPVFYLEACSERCSASPTANFADALEIARGSLKVRLWSAEVWCRSVFAGESPSTIEKDLWPHGP